MQDNNSFSSFYARLSAQTALCNWPLDQERATLKDLFIGRIRNVEVQRQLIRAKANLDDTLQLALEIEKRAKASEQFQKLFPHNNVTSTTTNSIRVKQEPTSSVQQFKNQGNSSRGGGLNRPNLSKSTTKNQYIFAVTRFPLNIVGRVRSEKLLAMLAKRRVILLRCVTLQNDALTWYKMRRYLQTKSAI